ncbi:ribonuclease J [Candidatus Parcubacteria bacterium]|nr:ribonuclease J [Candidatus Parcubacteria bacterium]
MSIQEQKKEGSRPSQQRTQRKSGPRSQGQNKSKSSENVIKIAPLGGMGEVGRNMMFLEYKGKILIVDAGLRMPEESMPGIDYIIPNTNYLKDNKEKIVGCVITHGHLDHIGAIPYMWHRLGNPRIFTGRLSKGIISKRQEEFPLRPKLDVTEIKDGSQINLGPFRVEFFRQVHNILDNFGLVIKTDLGNIVHTSDFTFDQTPVNEPPSDLNRLRQIAQQGVLLLMSDSTGAEHEGKAISEKVVFDNLDQIFRNSQGSRIIASTFASHISRVKQIIELAEKYNRKVILEGRSMKDFIEISRVLGLVKAKQDTFVKPEEIRHLKDNQVCFVCTGAQGEERASLMKIANGEYRNLNLKKDDVIIFSSSVIPGNERTVQILKDELYRKGAKVYHYQMMDIHSSGHGYQEELTDMLNIMKPKFFMPLHGQFSMLVKHTELAEQAGVQKGRAIAIEPGQVAYLNKETFQISGEEMQANYIMVDGLGIGDIGEIVLRDRQQLAQDGMFVIIAVVDTQKGKVKGSPDIISRGFVYLRESKDLLKEVRQKSIQIIDRAAGTGGAVNWSYIKDELRNKIGEFLFKKTQRRPIVLPVVIEV